LVEILFAIESPFSTKIAQSYIAQKSKLNWSLEEIHKRLGIDPADAQWSFEEIHGKNPLAIIHLLVTLAKYFDASQNLPKNVSIQVSVVKMTE
ncbi:hypothetical protein, partial [Salmonella sp. s51228]|uniref:hypothetical protein n=1 Tax=Salmonella sp. s51228 TaxID=3159652 RepID=UPI00397F93A1